MNDEKWLRYALDLAERGRGYVEPNPLVGSVVVREDQIVGEGWHQKYGDAHAEVIALTQAGAAARGATLYVTLEPCCHHGKTPPCTDAILRVGVRRVVMAMLDPFPEVAGQGKAVLANAGIEVVCGVCENEARQLNAPYLKLLSTGRPYVHAKWAMTLDGKIATRTGDSKWISGESSRQQVHDLRGKMDAILIGAGSAVADDPLLTARPPGPRLPMRIVLDSQGRTPRTSRLVQTAADVPTMIITTERLPREQAEAYRSAGVEIFTAPASRPKITDVLDELGRRRMTNILVEGGAEVLGSFVDADAIDEFHVYIAPRLAGGRDALTAVRGDGVEKMTNSLQLARRDVEIIGEDIFIHGWRSVQGAS